MFIPRTSQWISLVNAVITNQLQGHFIPLNLQVCITCFIVIQLKLSLPEMHLQINSDGCLVHLFKKLRYEIFNKGN